MKINGIGVDIVDNSRIKKTLNIFGEKFKERCFLKTEIDLSKIKKTKDDNVNFFSKRYAAKEACSKALGTGLAMGVTWKDIEVVNNKYGKPFIKLHNNALKIFNELSISKCDIAVSLSDEKNYSIANVVIFEI